MKYTVVWRVRAETELTALWIRARDKNAIAGYVSQIDRILGTIPREQGESRDDCYRVWFPRPLQVFFEIDEAGKMVYITSIRWIGK